jgi:hypothetical protein
MQTESAILPDFDEQGHHAITSPMRRTQYGLTLIALFNFFDLRFEFLA